jgi:hypothetical protein
MFSKQTHKQTNKQTNKQRNKETNTHTPEQLQYTHISDTNVYNFCLEQCQCDKHSVSYIPNAYRNACRCSNEVDSFVDCFEENCNVLTKHISQKFVRRDRHDEMKSMHFCSFHCEYSKSESGRIGYLYRFTSLSKCKDALSRCV